MQQTTPSTGQHPNTATVVLDIGKTNAKLTLLDAAGATLATQRCPNKVLRDGLYPHHDTERLWDWLLGTLTAFSREATITAIVPVTHGATAALIGDDGLVLPILDYESALPESLDDAYNAVRPPFAESYSPNLPVGLNLGRQLYWLAQTFPEDFARTRHILSYPQYWAWRLSGVAASEVTSLGCHTDLWRPTQGDYSSLVDQLGWRDLFPALRPAWAPLGVLHADLAAATGLPADCQVICGIHDSNASLLRYLDLPGAVSRQNPVDPSAAASVRHLGGQADAALASERHHQPTAAQNRDFAVHPAAASRTVLSTGTWVIAAAFGTPLAGLDERADMLANVNALGQPVACMRYMGGREFGVLAGAEPEVCSAAELQDLIGQGTLALPSFAEAGGPFSGRVGSIAGPRAGTPPQRYALATLYSVLMTDYCLSALGAAGEVIIEGSFTDNPFFAPLLAALRPGQAITLTDDASGTTCGGWMLHRWGDAPAPHSSVAAPLALDGWLAYRDRWRSQLPAR